MRIQFKRKYCELENEEKSFKTAVPESCKDCRTVFKTPGYRCLYSTEGCLLEHKHETHVLSYYLFPLSAAGRYHSHVGIELTPTIEDSSKGVADGGQ